MSPIETLKRARTKPVDRYDEAPGAALSRTLSRIMADVQQRFPPQSPNPRCTCAAALQELVELEQLEQFKELQEHGPVEEDPVALEV